MTWKRHFRVVGSKNHPTNYVTAPQPETGGAGISANFSSYLPEVYSGHPYRIQRYYQYDDMDRDSDIHRALDTIANFCTMSEEQTEEPFQILYTDDAVETEQKIIKSALEKWNKINNFRTNLWRIFRETVKNGDCFFLRDPETGEWLWLDHFSVVEVVVDQTNGKEPKEYVVRGLDYNKEAKFATKAVDTSYQGGPVTNSFQYTSRPGGIGGNTGNSSFQVAGSGLDQRTHKPGAQSAAQALSVIDAKHVIHLSMSVGLDINWPFGPSILEPIFKVYKQKELLEDAIIIYRVQRAPERRVFYIDTGDMNAVRAKAHIQSIKNEIHQRRIPNRTGGGTSILDAAYNPLSIMDDLFFAQSAEGRGSKVETLEGGENLGEIGDLDWFTRKLARGLGIPFSYLAISEEKSGTSFNDGKLGSALVEEFQFTKYCMRLQNAISHIFDREFKNFLRDDGVEIDENCFELRFNPPQNFGKYRDIDVKQAYAGLYSTVADNKYLSVRFKLKHFLGLTEDEILENERMWREENPSKMKKATGGTAADDSSDMGLSSVGLRGGDDFGGDLGGDDDLGDLGDDAGGDAGGDLGGDAGGDTGAAPGGGAGAAGGAGGSPLA